MGSMLATRRPVCSLARLRGLGRSRTERFRHRLLEEREAAFRSLRLRRLPFSAPFHRKGHQQFGQLVRVRLFGRKRRLWHGMLSVTWFRTALQTSHHQQDNDDQQDDADGTSRSVAPAASVRPRGQNTYQNQDQDNQKNGADTHGRSLVYCSRSARRVRRSDVDTSTRMMLGLQSSRPRPLRPYGNARWHRPCCGDRTRMHQASLTTSTPAMWS